MTGALAAEWVKLRSVRSTHTLLGAAAAGVLLAALLARQGVSLSPLEQLVSSLSQLWLALLGVLAITAEYATGTVQLTLAAVPSRWPVLVAKSVLVAAVSLAAGEAVGLAVLLVSRLVAGGAPPLAHELPALLGQGLAVMVVALVGLGLGTVVRSAAGAAAGVVALLLVLPTIAGFVPPPWGDRLASVMLPGLAGELAGSGSGVNALGGLVGGAVGSGALLPPAAALAVMTAYAAVALGAGGLAVLRRDA